MRTAAAGATTISEFLDRLHRDGVLVHERHSERNPGEITGYAVASADSLDAAGKPVYYGGGRLAAAGVGRDKRPVYHLVISARKDPGTGELVDRYLSDSEWRAIAATYLDHIGLAPRGDDLGCRWVAVRHADDHVHVVVTLARQDGRRVFPHNDYYRAGEASREVEAEVRAEPHRRQ